jgi:hypothetical protein
MLFSCGGCLCCFHAPKWLSAFPLFQKSIHEQTSMHTQFSSSTSSQISPMQQIEPEFYYVVLEPDARHACSLSPSQQCVISNVLVIPCAASLARNLLIAFLLLYSLAVAVRAVFVRSTLERENARIFGVLARVFSSCYL